MKKPILFLFFSLALLTIYASTQYSERWKKVEEFTNKQLPESAMEEVNNILKEAQKSGDFAETVKAYIYKMRITLEKDPFEAQQVITDFETFSKTFKNPAESAILHSMTAELYSMYYTSNQYTINQRTAIEGFTPENITEWSKNNFFDKISEEIGLSLQNPAVLQDTKISAFEALIEKGTDGEVYQPTLYDFLGQRAIDILKSMNNIGLTKNPLNDARYFTTSSEFIQLTPEEAFSESVENQIIEVYQNLLAFRLKENNIPALVYIDLERLEYIRANTENLTSDELYLNALENMKSRYIGNESILFVYEKLANFYLTNSYQETEETRNYKRVAYDTAREGINLFPNSKNTDALQNIINNITQKNVSVNYPTAIRPTGELTIKTTTQNLTELELNIYRVDATAEEYFTFTQNNRRYESVPYPNRTLVETKYLTVPADENFGNTESAFNIIAKQYGIYEFSVGERGNTTRKELANGAFTVTDLAYIERSTKQNENSLYVVNRNTGNTIEGVNIKVTSSEWNGKNYILVEDGTKSTNKNGFTTLITKKYSPIFFLSKGEDRYFSSQSGSYFYNYNEPTDRNQLALFTDRSLYRPGQTVYFKGIAYSAKKQEIIKNASYEIKLWDVNGQEVSKKSFKTNEFGSFAGEFVLPESGLNGAYQIISNDNFSVTIYVEEYKRPTFEVKIDKTEEEVRFNEPVTFKGNVKAYAGYPVADSQVKYTIVRRNHRFWWWNYTPDKYIASGITTSDADGKFEVTFTPEKTKQTTSFYRDQFYTYTLQAEVTDSKGETQKGVQSISVGDKSLFIIANLQDKYNKEEELPLYVYTETLNGKIIPSTVNYTLYQLENQENYREKIEDISKIKEIKEVLSGTFNTDTDDKLLKLNVKNLNSGYYKIVFTTKDSQGQEVKTESVFILYSEKDKKPPVKSYTWLLAPKTNINTGEKAEIRFGTSAEKVSVLYEIMQGNTVLESKWITLNNEVKTFDISLKPEYGDGVQVKFTFVKDEQLFVESVSITKKSENKPLSPTFSVFRDKLKPGEEVEWTVNIPETADGKKIAELMIGMYDASLDAIRPHYWSFSPEYRSYIPYSPTWNARGFNQGYANGYYDVSNTYIEPIKLDQLNWFGLNYSLFRSDKYRGIDRRMFTGSANVAEAEEAIIDGVSVKEMLQGKAAGVQMSRSKQAAPSSDMILEESIVEQDMAESITGQENPVTIRTNFNETAFFYPQLKTDADGNIQVSFTAPESLTRWNVKMLAHTPDLYYGKAEKEVITQKELMVQLNMPRFVRRSDKLTLVASVINLTENAITANVRFDLINPENEQIIPIKDNLVKQVTLASGETQAVQWEIDEFSGYELVIARITAQSEIFSDGEQRYLPVLPDKVLLTESLPLTIRGNETRTFRFGSFINQFNSVDTKDYIVEFSSNPAWYAVQALPTISAPENENAIDYFTAFYANSLATYVANSNPQLSAMFDRWKKEGGSREALLSNLEKNTELKNMLLEETPWVMDAKDETEQKRQIALLFELNQQKNQNKQYLDKLLKMQKPSGGFPWFEGMSESRYITQIILLNMARYNKMVKSNEPAPQWIKNALTYLDLHISRDYDYLKKNNKNYLTTKTIGDMQWFYLHLRSEYKDVPINKSAQEAVDYYTKQAETYWTNATLYGKAATALITYRNGNTAIANDILKSLKENAVKSDELGMYWARNTAGYFWNERPIGVQTAVLEAFAEISNNQNDIDEMKIWLLKQKQTQRWDSPISTVDAIYALMMYGTDWLSENGSVEITVGNKILQPETTEAGTGYFKETLEPSEITSNSGNITVNKTGASIGWGAAYWQYYQDIDKVNEHGKSLSVTKKLFVERTDGTKKSMIPVEQTQLNKGDKVITRLVITTDRDLEFVALKDLRAACLEPVEQRSHIAWKEKVIYYETIKDASTQFFFNFLPKGTYVFEHASWVNNTGDFANGMATIQCQYAPEFVSHSSGGRIQVK